MVAAAWVAVAASSRYVRGISVKIAIAKEGPMVAAHFGRCPEYAVVEVADGRALNPEVIPNPGHEPGFLPGYLAELGVGCIIAGGMGPRAQGLFVDQGIETIVGVSCSVDEAIQAYVSGTLEHGSSMCEHDSWR